MNQRIPMLLAAVFLIPVIAALFALQMHWFTAGTANKGDWLTQEIQIAKLQTQSSLQESWKVVYVMPAQCLTHCQTVLDNISNGYATLGRKQRQVKLMRVVSAKHSPTPTDEIAALTSFTTITVPEKSYEQLTAGALYLVDHQGQFILRYPTDNDAINYAQIMRDWLADTKRLLAYARKNR